MGDDLFAKLNSEEFDLVFDVGFSFTPHPKRGRESLNEQVRSRDGLINSDDSDLLSTGKLYVK